MTLDEELREKLMLSRIPYGMHESIVLWVLYGPNSHPGSFLTAVLVNDLREACARADDVNRHRLWDYVNFLYNHAPAECWGSVLNFQNWKGMAIHPVATEEAGP